MQISGTNIKMTRGDIKRKKENKYGIFSNTGLVSVVATGTLPTDNIQWNFSYISQE